MFNDDKFEPQ